MGKKPENIAHIPIKHWNIQSGLKKIRTADPVIFSSLQSIEKNQSQQTVDVMVLQCQKFVWRCTICRQDTLAECCKQDSKFVGANHFSRLFWSRHR
jgi:hypothetical protein